MREGSERVERRVRLEAVQIVQESPQILATERRRALQMRLQRILANEGLVELHVASWQYVQRQHVSELLVDIVM